MKNKERLEIRVGLFIIFAIFLFFGFVYFLKFKSTLGGIPYSAEFEFVGDLTKNSSVKLSGITIGRITDIRLYRKKNSSSHKGYLVRVDFRIDKKYKDLITEDTQVFVSSRGVFGEQFLELVTSSEGKIASPGTVFIGHGPARMDLLMSSLSEIINQVGALLSKNKELIKSMLISISKLADSTNTLFVEKKNEINTILTELVKTTKAARVALGRFNIILNNPKNVRHLIDDSKDLVKDLKYKLPNLLEQMDNMTKRMNRVFKVLEDLSGQNGQKAHKAIKELSSLINDSKSLIKELHYITSRLKNGKGTLGALLKEDALYKDLKALVKELRAKPWKLIWKD